MIEKVKAAQAEKEALEERIEALRAETTQWASGFHQEMADYYEDRSDTWKESDNGDAYAEWVGAAFELANLPNGYIENLDDFLVALGTLDDAPDKED